MVDDIERIDADIDLMVSFATLSWSCSMLIIMSFPIL